MKPPLFEFFGHYAVLQKSILSKNQISLSAARLNARSGSISRENFPQRQRRAGRLRLVVHFVENLRHDERAQTAGP